MEEKERTKKKNEKERESRMFSTTVDQRVNFFH
jgi:hypothetical protein